MDRMENQDAYDVMCFSHRLLKLLLVLVGICFGYVSEVSIEKNNM